MPTSVGKATYLLTSDLLADSRHRDALVRLAQGEKPGKAARGGLLTKEQRDWVHLHVAKVAWPTLLPEERGMYETDATQGRKKPKPVQLRARLPWQDPEGQVGSTPPAASSSSAPRQVEATAQAASSMETPVRRRLDFEDTPPEGRAGDSLRSSRKAHGSSWSTYGKRRRAQLRTSLKDIVSGAAQDSTEAADMIAAAVGVLASDFPDLSTQLMAALRTSECRCQPLLSDAWLDCETLSLRSKSLMPEPTADPKPPPPRPAVPGRSWDGCGRRGSDTRPTRLSSWMPR